MTNINDKIIIINKTMQDNDIKQIISKAYNSRLNKTNLIYTPKFNNQQIFTYNKLQLKEKQAANRICLYKNLSPEPKVSKQYNLSTTNQSIEKTKQTSPTSRLFTEYDQCYDHIKTETFHKKSNSNSLTAKNQSFLHLRMKSYCDKPKNTFINPAKTTKNANVDLSYLKKSTVFANENFRNFDKKSMPLYKKCLEIEKAVNKLSNGSINFASFKQMLIKNEVPINDILVRSLFYIYYNIVFKKDKAIREWISKRLYLSIIKLFENAKFKATLPRKYYI